MVKLIFCPLCDKEFYIFTNRSIIHCPDCNHHLNLKTQEELKDFPDGDQNKI